MRRLCALFLVLVACSSDDSDGLAGPSAGASGGGQGGAGSGGASAGTGGAAAGVGGSGGAGGQPQAGAGQGGVPAGQGGAGQAGATSSSGGVGGELAGGGQAGDGGTTAAGAGVGGAGAAGATVCTPGATQECVGPGACKGGQACEKDGSGYGPCDCGTSGGAGAGGAAGTGGASAGKGGSAGGPPLVCGACPDELGTALWDKPTTEKDAGAPVTYCIDGFKADFNPPECWLTVDIDKAKLTAKIEGQTVTFTGTVPVWLPASHHEANLGTFPITGEVKPPIQASLGKGQGGACEALNPTLAEVTWAGPLLANEAKPVFGCTPLGPSTAFELKTDEADFHICGKCDAPIACGVWDATIAGAANRIQARISEVARAALDDLATKRQCAHPTSEP